MMRITPLTLDSATVYPDRIELVVDIAHSRFAFSSKPLIAALLHTAAPGDFVKVYLFAQMLCRPGYGNKQ